ncbi:YndM family protein [Desertibacillus haloalkaliphilus]|nr:YndM family protein [Desertibacillus haloalkaliphilus]
MKHITALLIKTLMVTLVLLVVMSAIYNYPVGSTVALSLIVVALSYIIGDIGILRVSNNTVATISDLLLTTFVLWMVGPLIIGLTVSFWVSFISAVLISAGEYFFHKYVSSLILRKREDPYTQT